VPGNADAYLSIASAYLSSGRTEEAAISLMQTLLIDNGRTQAMKLLVNLYGQIDHDGCAVIMAEGQPRFNINCPIVHDHMCLAYEGLVQVFLETRQYDVAKRTEDTAVQTYHCHRRAFPTTSLSLQP
jgi:hypothetical protein